MEKSKQKSKSKKSKGSVQTVKAPAAQGKVMTVTAPNGVFSKGRAIIRHREYVGVVEQGAAGVASKAFNIVPNNKIIFPWLSKLASAYDNFRFKKFKAEFITALPTSKTGQYLLAYDPSPLQIPEVTIRKLGAQVGAKEVPVWQNKTMIAPPDALDSLPRYYVPQLDQKGSTFSAGHLYLLHYSDATAASIVGSLWVEYEVELYNPTDEIPAEAGGTMTIAGSGTNISGIPVKEAGSNLQWYYALGIFQGLRFRTGSYLVRWRIIITGGGACTSITPGKYDVSMTIGEIAEYLGTTSDSVFVVTCDNLNSESIHPGQLNLLFTTTGTVTTITHYFSVGEAPYGSLTF